MRIALFDGIVETHVGSSFERALIDAGHDVFNTGKIGHGYAFASATPSLRIIENALNQVLDYRPDVIFVFRPASLPFPLLKRAKTSGAVLVAWFSDDPVLWNLSYGPVVDSYDLVLHCGTARVLDFYQKVHGRPTGVNFPFWTDEIAFPYVYGTAKREHDALFLGNVHDEVRRRRYFDLASLDSSLKIYGNVGRDYFGIWGGYLDSDAEVVEAGRKAGVSINIPQYFEDHRGLDTWFDGLGNLGFFQYPSRVIQYAAMGLPIISVVPDAEDLNTFPEIQCASDMNEVDSVIRGIVGTDRAEKLSLATHERFLKNYSARSRVMALETLLVDDSWKSLDAVERSTWFGQFDGQKPNKNSKAYFQPVIPEREKITIAPPKLSRMMISIIGKSFENVTSVSSVAVRSFKNLGHEVTTIDVEHDPEIVAKDVSIGHNYEFKSANFLQQIGGHVDVIVLAGLDCSLANHDAEKLRASGIRIVYLGCSAHKVDHWLESMAARVDYLGLLNEDIAEKMVRNGHLNTEYLPYLVDEAFRSAVAKLPDTSDGVLVTGRRKSHFAEQAKAFEDLGGVPLCEVYLEQKDEVFHSLEGLAKLYKSTMAIVPYDASVLGPLPSEVLPFVLASGALTVVPRGTGPMNLGTPGVESVAVRERGELALKLSDLLTSGDRVSDILGAARRLVDGELNAELRLSSILTKIESSRQRLLSGSAGLSAKAGSLEFNPVSSSFVAWWRPVNSDGTTVDLEISSSDLLSSSHFINIDIRIDDMSVYNEVLSKGRMPIRLSVDICPGSDGSSFEVVQKKVDAFGNLNGSPEAHILIESVVLRSPNYPVSGIKVRTNSVWGSVR